MLDNLKDAIWESSGKDIDQMLKAMSLDAQKKREEQENDPFHDELSF